MKKYSTFFVLLVLLVSSCQSIDRSSPQSYNSQGQFVDGVILERPLPDPRGIITYQDYQVLVSNGIETVAEIAERLDVDPERLASYNGVLLTYLPRKDEIMALPTRIPGNMVSRPLNWTQEGARQAITKSLGESSSNLTRIGTPENPLRHRVEVGDTAYSVSRLYNVSVTALAKWNGLDTDLKLVSGRELIIPVASANLNQLPTNPEPSSNMKNQLKQSKPQKTATELNIAKNETSQAENVPKDDTKATALEDQTKQSEQKPFLRPVSGRVLRAYNPTASKNKNEGIDFYAAPGTPVKAAADGVVALISKPVGGMGKIILLKHDESIISIYGRVKDLTVTKGMRVTRGQLIGKVESSFLDKDSPTANNYLHFELRKGTKSLDPSPLLQ